MDEQTSLRAEAEALYELVTEIETDIRDLEGGQQVITKQIAIKRDQFSAANREYEEKLDKLYELMEKDQ